MAKDMGKLLRFLPWLVEHHRVLGGTCNQALHRTKDLRRKDHNSHKVHRLRRLSNRLLKEVQLQLEHHQELHVDQ